MAERRQLTVLFCDLVGSTVLSGKMDPEDLRELVLSYQEACSAVVTRFDGHVAQLLGDGLLIYFGFPKAHEEDARRAVSAGLAILEEMRRPMQGQRLQVRVGIHTGQVVIGELGGEGHQEQLALGEAPNIAARVQGEALPDWVVISEATRNLVKGFFVLETLGERTLKGVSQPVSLYRVMAESGAVTRMHASEGKRTPFVGREGELEVVLGKMAEAARGRGQLVLLRGEPGIGKSRLVEVVRQTEAAQRFEVFELQCSPLHSNSALYPVIQMLGRRLGLRGAASASEKLDLLERSLTRTAPHASEALALLASLLGIESEGRYPKLEMTSQTQRQRTLEVLKSWWLKVVAQRPILLLMEDLHWADATTLELVRLVLEEESPGRLLGLLTFRSEFQPPWKKAEHMTELMLRPLPAEEVSAMVTSLARRKPLPPKLQEQLVLRAGGIPLFAEELAHAVLEMGLLEERADRYEMKGPLPADLLPATVQGLLMARLDRLDTARPIAQLAATLGREFSYEVLWAVCGRGEAELQRELGRLVDAGLLFYKEGPAGRRYEFKHALVRDAAYDSLLRKTRQQYHRQVVEVLRTRFPELVEAEPDVVALHCEGGGLVWEATAEWRRAGEQALSQAAYQEGAAHLERALALLATHPESLERDKRELGLQIELGSTYTSLRGWSHPSVERAYVRAFELSQRLGGDERIAPILWGLWANHFVVGNYPKTQEAVQHLRTLAAGSVDPIARELTDHAVVSTRCMRGDFAEAGAVALDAQRYFDLARERVIARQLQVSSFASIWGYGAVALWSSGRLRQADTAVEKLLAMCRELNHPPSDASGWWLACWMEVMRRRPEQVSSLAHSLLRLAEERKFLYWLPLPPIAIGWARIHQGDEVERSVEQMLASFETYRGMLSSGAALGCFCFLVADGLMMAGRLEQALRVVEDGLAHGERTHWQVVEPDLLRLKGEVLLRQGEARTEEGEGWLRRALQRARELGAPRLELRAAMSLGRLWRAQGREAEAVAVVDDASQRIPEPAEELELIEARAFLGR